MNMFRLFIIVALMPVYVFAAGDCSMVSEYITLQFGVETEIPDPNEMFTLDVYHTDVELSFTASGWDVEYSYDPPAGEMDIQIDHGLLYVNENNVYNLSYIPSGYEFIGFTPNEDFWILPQTSKAGVLHLGFAAQESDSANPLRLGPERPG